MPFTTLISASELANNLHQTNWVVFDARFNLARPEAGAAAYRQGHIPKARYVHLNNDLSSPITSFTGRHPLPDLQLLAKKLGLWGANNNSQIVIYDDANGAIAGRMWYLLRCLGHDQVLCLMAVCLAGNALALRPVHIYLNSSRPFTAPISIPNPY